MSIRMIISAIAAAAVAAAATWFVTSRPDGCCT